MRSAIAVALAGVIWCAPVQAQTAPAQPPPAFEVASIKPNRSRDAAESVTLEPSGGVRMTGFLLISLIRAVYASDTLQTPEQIIGGPPWIRSDRFDIVAKAEGDLMFDAEGRRPARAIAMLKTLIADRFGVKVHMESRRMPAFALTLSRRDHGPGPQLRLATTECARSARGVTPVADPPNACGFRRVPGTITARYVTMQEVGAYFSGFAVISRPVQDRTGLTGRYDLRVDFMEGPDADPGNLFTALQEQLGLTFERETALLPVLVIDRAEHPTTD